MSQPGRVGAGGGVQETRGGVGGGRGFLSVFQCGVLQRSGLSPQLSERGSQGRVGLLTPAPLGD